MQYLLDANVLITANREYYEIGRVDEYWDWLVFRGEIDNVKIPIEIYEEIKIGTDALATWAKDRDHEAALILDEDVDIDLVRRVTEEGYAPDLTDIEIDAVGRDPFLIAYALADPSSRCVVTGEKRSNQQRQNRKIPSVCDQFGIRSCDQFQFGRDLDFRTNWTRPS